MLSGKFAICLKEIRFLRSIYFLLYDVFYKYPQVMFYNTFLKPAKLRELNKKQVIRVGFEIWNVSMWKSASLYELMRQDSRFDPYVIITPTPSRDFEERLKDFNEIKEFCEQKKYKIIYEKNQTEALCYSNKLPIDIIFPCQPYLPKKLTKTIKDYLFCFTNYGFSQAIAEKWNKDTLMGNIFLAWFVETPFEISDSKKVAFNRAKNRFITGHVYADTLIERISEPISDKWKKQDRNKKKVIWAPHFSIGDNNLNYSTFLKIADSMFEIVEKYSDVIQWAFKPHPFLYDQLCKSTVWGKERTDAYYKKWETGSNTQYESGDYADLFALSDAMIHDSGSFIVEYLYTKKPCMYLNNSDGQMNTFGKMALKNYYRGDDYKSIEFFLDTIVLKGNDDLLQSRETFYNEYLLPPYCKSAAHNIVDIICAEIWKK